MKEEEQIVRRIAKQLGYSIRKCPWWYTPFHPGFGKYAILDEKGLDVRGLNSGTIYCMTLEECYAWLRDKVNMSNHGWHSVEQLPIGGE